MEFQVFYTKGMWELLQDTPEDQHERFGSLQLLSCV